MANGHTTIYKTYT